MIKTIKSTKGEFFFKRIWLLIKIFCKGLRNNSIIFRTIVNYSLPVIAIYFSVMAIQEAAQIEFVVSVDYNGENIGYVSDEYVVESAKEMVDDRIVYLDENEKVEIQPSFSISTVSVDTVVINEYQLADELVNLSSDDMIEADGLYIDGEFIGAVTDIGSLDEALELMLDEYRSLDGYENAKISFTKDVQVVTGLYVTPNIVDTQETIDMLTGEVQGDVYHIVGGNDTLSGIAEEYDIPSADLYAMNPDVEPTLMHDGDQILISQKVAYLPIQVVKEIVYSETVDYDTIITESDEYTINVEKTLTEGVDGENEITAEVTYIDGIETDREIISKTVVSEPIDEEILQGTAPLVVESSTGSGTVNSGFVWPMDGYVSSEYGYRWGSLHAGIDIARYGGAYGASIYAVADGVVVYSAYSTSGYGKLIKIDHGNGLQTWYAHASVLNVSVGDNVTQGQKIAEAGETGNVTGPHLHFEVRVNGITQDPRNYLS